MVTHACRKDTACVEHRRQGIGLRDFRTSRNIWRQGRCRKRSPAEKFQTGTSTTVAPRSPSLTLALCQWHQRVEREPALSGSGGSSGRHGVAQLSARYRSYVPIPLAMPSVQSHAATRTLHVHCAALCHGRSQNSQSMHANWGCGSVYKLLRTANMSYCSDITEGGTGADDNTTRPFIPRMIRIAQSSPSDAPDQTTLLAGHVLRRV